jgi:ElaB/YqjD/DUF883 family membrane-anchored ribosome-binding protein
MGSATLNLLAGGLITTLLFSTGPTASFAGTEPKTVATVPEAAVMPAEGMSAAATKVLHHIVEARALVHRGEAERAEDELRKALARIDQIKAVRPSTRIADHIWVAEKHLEYQEPHEVALDLIPIEISMADLEEVVSAKRAERHLEQTKAHLGRGDAEAARKELTRLRENLAQTEVDLPLASTEQHINSAFAWLAEGNTARAEAALKAAEAGVQLVSLGKSIPIAKARRALWQAVEAYSSGHHDAVESDLNQALKWLERVEAGSDTKTGQEAQRLRLEINELLGRESRQGSGAETELSGFWHRAVGLVERDAEKLYHAWRDQQSENHLYRLLIDAKLHLFYAEHELFESGDTEGAKQELEETAGYLREAAAEASGPRKARIEALEKEVTSLLPPAVDAGAEDTRSRYEEALAELRRMVAHN